MRKDSILQNFYNSKLSKAKNGGPVDRNGKPNLSQIIEGNKDKTSHITRKVKTSLPKQKFGGGMFPRYHSYAPPRMDEGGGPCPVGFVRNAQGVCVPKDQNGKTVTVDGKVYSVDSNEYKDMLDKGQVGTMQNGIWYGNKSDLQPFKVFSSKDKDTQAFYNALRKEYDPEQSDALIETGMKYGTPHVTIHKGKPGFFDPTYPNDPNKIRPHYIARRIHLGDNSEDWSGDYLAELAHHKQMMKFGPIDFTSRVIKMMPRIIKNTITNNGGYEKEYETPGSIEYEAHQEIEPKLRDEYNDLMFKKFDESDYYEYPGHQSFYKPKKTYKKGGGIIKMVNGGVGPCPKNMYWDTLSKKCVLRPAPFVTSDFDEYNKRLQLASDSTNAAVASRADIEQNNINSANQKTVTSFNQNPPLETTDKSYKEKPKVVKRVTKYKNEPSKRYTTNKYKEKLVKEGNTPQASNEFVDQSASVISGDQIINPVAITRYPIEGNDYDEKGNVIGDPATTQYIPEFQEAKQEVKLGPPKYSVTYSTPDGKQHTFPYIYDYDTWKLINDRYAGSRAYVSSQEKGDKSEASLLLKGLTEEDFNNILNEEYVEGNTKPVDNLFDSKPTSSIASVEYVQANNKKYGGDTYTNNLDYFNPNFKFNEMGGRITTSAMNLRKYVNGGALCKDMFGNTIDCPPGYTAGSTVFATQTPNVSSSTSAGVPQRNAGMLNDLRARQSFQNQASVGPARMQTLDEQKLNQQRKQQFVQNNPNTQLNGQNVIVSRNPNRGFQGQPLTPNAKRWDKGLGHITTGLEAAGYLTGAGAGINALRNKLGKQVSTLALTEEEMAQAMAEGIDEAGSYGISPDQYRKMLQDQQLRQQTGKMVRGMEKNPSDQHPIAEWFRSSNTREFGDEMKGAMRQLGYEPTNPKDIENFRNFFNQRSGQLFLNDQKPVGYGQTLTNMFSNPMNRYGGSINQYGPGGQTTDGCGPGFDRHPILGTCIPNGWMPPTQTQAGPTVEAAEQMRKAKMLNDAHEIAARAKYRNLQPGQGQQATVGRSSSDEPWRQRQAAEIRRQEAMKNTELAQSFAGLTPSGDINAGVIGANTFANMTPGIGIIPASARLANFINSQQFGNQRNNVYFSKNNNFGENALGALNFVGDIGMLGIGSPLKGAGYNVSEGMPGVTQAGFNPIRGAKKFINKAYNSMDEMFGGSGDDVLFSDIQNKSKPSNVTSQAEVTPQVERTYPFENQAEVVHNNNTYFINKDNPTEIMMQEEGQSTLTHASEADIPKVQEKYSATLPKETTTPTTPEPVQQTAAQQPAAPAQTPPPAPKPLNENLNSARAQSNPTPPPSPTEKNTGQPAPAPATPPKKGMGFGQVVKPILKGVGVLGGIGLGMYGINKIYSNSTPPTKPFTNGPTNNTVAPSDTNFYGTPQVDTSMNQYADTTTAPVIIDSNINAPLTQEEIRQALDTSGIHRYGGQRMEEGGYPKPNLRLPQFQSYRPSYGVNPYIYNERPNPNVNVFGAGLQGFGQVAPRVGINAGINMQRVSTPNFSGWQKPNYNVGMSYRFQNGGSISIEGLQNALNNIKI